MNLLCPHCFSSLISPTYFAIHLYKNQHIIILISYIPIISEKPKPPINYKLDSFDMELFGLFFHFQINIFSSDAMNVLFHFAFVHKVVMQSCESRRQKGKKVYLVLSPYPTKQGIIVKEVGVRNHWWRRVI